jgi:L-alanine-DL-glutamate epimerase-like enolase superfamily enzyme
LLGTGVGRWADVQRAATLFEQSLVGADPRAAPALYQKLIVALPTEGDRLPAMRAIAVIDQALWDLKARAANVPLWRQLGASGVPVRAALRLAGSAVDHSALVAGGYRAAVLEADADVRGKAAAVLAALTVNDPLPDLAIAIAAGTSLEELEALARSWTDAMDIARLELQVSEPMSWTTLRALTDQLPTAISVRDHMPVCGLFPDLSAFAVDVVVIDVALRGITGSLQLAEAAYAYDLPVVLARSPGRFTAHLAGVLPSLAAVEVDAAEQDQPGLIPGIRVADGTVHLSDAPGIGWAWAEEGAS